MPQNANVEKILFLNLLESRCKYRDTIKSILVSFTFIFSNNLFSQIFVNDASVLTITDGAFISSSSNNPTGKIYISENTVITNIEAFDNAEFIKVPKKKIAKSGRTKKVKSSNENKKTQNIVNAKRKKSDLKFVGDNSQKIAQSFVTAYNVGVILPSQNMLAIFTSSDRSFCIIDLYSPVKSLSDNQKYGKKYINKHTVRPPPYFI